MLTIEQSRSLSAYELSASQARRVVEVAIRRRVRVSLIPRNDPEATLNGEIVSGTSESLWIGLGEAGVSLKPDLQSVCCEAVMDLDRERYLFETNVLAVVEDEEGQRLEVVRPEGLQVLQRRRFWRDPVTESVEVQLARSSPDGSELWSGTAALLNVSPAGLACLAPRDEADALAIGDVLQVVFELPRVEASFTLGGTVSSKTPAGTATRTVIGLEFQLKDNRDQFHRLQAALAPYA